MVSFQRILPASCAATPSQNSRREGQHPPLGSPRYLVSVNFITHSADGFGSSRVYLHDIYLKRAPGSCGKPLEPDFKMPFELWWQHESLKRHCLGAENAHIPTVVSERFRRRFWVDATL